MAKKQILSPEQDFAANPAENVWVQANAGTGKTSVLVQRLLRIMFRSADCKNSGILCLTYTNAGAGEMRNRILAALRGWAMMSDDDLRDALFSVAEHVSPSDIDIAHAREIFFYYIDNPDMLKIKTIHGFCEEILRRFPIEAGISPSWSLVSGVPQKILLQEAFNRLINTSYEDTVVFTAFERIVERVSENFLDDLLGLLSSKYRDLFQINDIINYRKYFIDTTYNFLKLDDLICSENNTDELEKIIETATEIQKSKKTPVDYLDNIITLTKQYIDTTVDFEKYKTAYLKQDGNIQVKILKNDFLTSEAMRVYQINQQNINRTIFQDTVALFDLCVAFNKKYHQIKQEHNLLDFDDLILYTRKLFSDSATMGWVLSQLDVSLSHILVDEAQDTSPLQWDILRMISGDFFASSKTSQMPNSMFVVGDTKQSIYGFQGADPSAFSHSRAEIAAQIKNNMRDIQEIPLAQSFRSVAPILNTVDSFFSDKDVRDLTGFVNNSHKCFRLHDKGYVHINKLYSKQDDTDTSLTGYINDISDEIQRVLNTNKYQPSDIMVLVQRRSLLAAPLVAELKRRNIAVAGSDRISLPDFPLVRDLLNLVRWCLDDTDDFSLCCVLKSPMFYLKEVDIYKLCAIRNDTNRTIKQSDSDAKTITVYDVLEQSLPDVYARLTTIKDNAQNLSPYSFFCDVLNTDNTRQRFVSALGAQVIDPLEEFITICLSYERTQSGTMRDFLKWFITGGSEVVRDMNTASGVRIVTVHGSKGLEAPVVFLVDTVRMPKSEKILSLETGRAPVWLWGVGAADSAIYNTLSEQCADKKLAEYYRLLYVAMTRARDILYIYGYSATSSAPEKSWHTQLWRVFSTSDQSDFIRITNEDIA